MGTTSKPALVRRKANEKNAHWTYFRVQANQANLSLPHCLFYAFQNPRVAIDYLRNLNGVVQVNTKSIYPVTEVISFWAQFFECNTKLSQIVYILKKLGFPTTHVWQRNTVPKTHLRGEGKRAWVPYLCRSPHVRSVSDPKWEKGRGGLEKGPGGTWVHQSIMRVPRFECLNIWIGSCTSRSWSRGGIMMVFLSWEHDKWIYTYSCPVGYKDDVNLNDELQRVHAWLMNYVKISLEKVPGRGEGRFHGFFVYWSQQTRWGLPSHNS
jgi:hypothetical protein